MANIALQLFNIGGEAGLILPIEVIARIMYHLSHSDRLSASLVNRAWHSALSYLNMPQDEVIVIRECRDLIDVLDVLENCERRFYHIELHNIELRADYEIWERFGPHLKSITLKYCFINEKRLMDTLSLCPKLEALHIKFYDRYFKPNHQLPEEEVIRDEVYLFESLQHIYISGCRYLTDVLFNNLIRYCPNLKSMSFKDCKITFNYDLHAFDITNNDAYYPTSDLTFYNIYDYISHHPKNIKYLDFSGTFIDDVALNIITQIPGLDLKGLLIGFGGDHLTGECIYKAIRKHRNLETLAISSCRSLTSEVIHEIGKLYKLKVLRIDGCNKIKNSRIRQFLDCLINLTELNISGCRNLLSNCFMQQSSPYKHNRFVSRRPMHINNIIPCPNLKVLIAADMQWCPTTISNIVEKFENLHVLNLSRNNDAVNNQTMQVISKYLIHLRVLKVSHCVRLTDTGITGYIYGLGDIRSSYRLSRESPFPLKRLTKLRELDITGCSNLTDLSFRHGFGFPELKTLHMSELPCLTNMGAFFVAKYNQSIEVLKMNDCPNINDVGICGIAKNLPRLKSISVQGCSQLTEMSLLYFKRYAHSLRYLNIYDCRIDTDVSGSIGRISVVQCYVPEDEE